MFLKLLYGLCEDNLDFTKVILNSDNLYDIDILQLQFICIFIANRQGNLWSLNTNTYFVSIIILDNILL
jgi:hypothetical protein